MLDCNDLGVFEAAQGQLLEMVEQLSAAPREGWEHGEVERYVSESGLELLRRLFQGYLDKRYEEEDYVENGVLGGDGEERPHRRKRTVRKLETLFGQVEVSRVGYRGECVISGRWAVELATGQVLR